MVVERRDEPDPRVLGRLLLIQSTLHVMPGAEGAGELVGRGLDALPGARSLTVCIDGRPVARSGADLAQAAAEAKADCPIGGGCWSPPSIGRLSIPVATLDRHFGCLVFEDDGSGRLALYEPYLRNTANTLATTLETREQRARLERLNQDLRGQVARKQEVEAVLLETQRGLERAVEARTRELVRVNDELAAEIRERRLAQERSAWEASLNAAVARLAHEMLRAASLDEIAAAVLEHAMRATGSACGFVGYSEPGSGDLVCPARSRGSWGPPAPGPAVYARSDGWAWLIDSRAPILANDGSAGPACAGGARPDRFLAVPAVVGDAAAGQIVVAEAPRDYDARDLELLRQLAELYAIAIDRDRQAEERRRLETLVQRAQRLESVGVLTGGIAHEFRNLLQIIQSLVDLLLREPAIEGSAAHRRLLEVSAAVERGAGITGQLLSFSRKAEIRVTRVDANDLVRDVARLLERTLPKMIRVELRLASDAGAVDADAGQLFQVLVNLAVNARDAMPGGGLLEITTARTRADSEARAGAARSETAEGVSIGVRDTGHGMDEETARRVFDPFFTTKDAGSGTGLGLAVAEAIVRAHGGRILCQSAPGRGATFTVVLRAAVEEAPTITGPKEPATAPARGRETILLVDDEAAILRALKTVLSANGYRVLTASTGEEALDVYRARAGEIDLVVIDLGLPGAGGEHCIRQIRATDGSARVIVSSGSEWRGWMEVGVQASLVKPYPMAELLAVVRRVLDVPR